MTNAVPRDAFGRLLVDPGHLDLAGRVDAVRRLSGELQAAASLEARWLGRALAHWLAAGGALEAVLGLRPPRGSKRTAQAMLLRDRQAHALLALSTALGGDGAALRVLQGVEACPERCADLLAEARRLGCPTSRSAMRRARQASRHNR